MAAPTFKMKLRALISLQMWQILRVVKYSLHFKGTESMATFALRIKARGPAFTLQKKILRKMAFDRDSMQTLYADKVKVREFVKERVGLKYLTASFGEFSSIEGLDRNSFPRNFVMKSNHGSGASVICWEGVSRGFVIPVKDSSRVWEVHLIHPDDLVWEKLVKLSNSWMKANFYWEAGRFPEWAYRNIEPQILVEEVLTHNGNIPEDYKFFMINGECIFVQVRHAVNQRDLYSPGWDLMDAKFLYPASGLRPERPIQLTEMLSLAKSLAKNIDFVRVDLYITDNGIKFGELTNYPDGGLADIRPKKLSIELAKKWIQNY